MNSIILSDTAILSSDYQSTMENIYNLKLLQMKGYKLVILSNRPELCMRKIGAYMSPRGDISYNYLGLCDTKRNGIDVIFHNGDSVIEEINLKYDYTIFGNGICAFNRNDELVYQGKFISRELLNEMIETIRNNGYTSMRECLRKDRCGDMCFKGREDVYKFFTPTIGTAEITDNIYGMQCSSRSLNEDKYIVEQIEKITPDIIGYILNNKPCFYQKEINKLVALNYLASNYGINIDDAIILLSEPTDDVINHEYKADNAIDCADSAIKYSSINPILKRVM